MRTIAYKFCLNDTVIKPVHIGPYSGFSGDDFGICNNQLRTIQPSITGTAYEWQDGSQNRMYSVSKPGVYWTDVTTDGCVSRDSVVVTNSHITSDVSETICEGKQYAGYTTPGIYTGVLTAANGCDSVRLLHLSVLPSSASAFAYTVCKGQSYLGYTTAGLFIDTLRAVNGCDSVRTLQLTVLHKSVSSLDTTICNGENYLGYTASGTCTDTLVAANGCDSIRTIALEVRGKPSPQLRAEMTICAEDEVVISPGNCTTYLWQDGSKEKRLVINKAGLYKVTVSNECGTATAGEVVKTDNYGYVFPSAFSPDHDGKNDVFAILSTYDIQQFHLLVYNRFGQKILEKTDYTKGWDGLLNGIPADAGMYVWYASFTTVSQKQVSKYGTVVLLR